MPVTFTTAGLQTELESFRAGLAARNWSDALDAANNYYAVRRGIVDKVTAEGVTVEVPKEPTPTLYEQINATKAVSIATTRPRVIHANTSYRVP